MLCEKCCAIVVNMSLLLAENIIKTVLKEIKASGSVKSNTMNKKCLDSQMLLLRFSYTFTHSLGSYRVTKHSCYCINNTDFPVKVTGLLQAVAKE